MTLQIGQTVDVIVKSVRTYGLFCVHDENTELLVLIPETSWTASYCSCEQFADVGDHITVKILHIEEDTGKIAASVRHRFPDPWATDTFQPGRSFTATVARHVDSADRCGNGPGCLLELVPGAFVMLCTPGYDLTPGDTCDVTITDVKPDAHAVSVSLANTECGEQ